MRFSEFTYARPEIVDLTAQFDEYLNSFDRATGHEEQNDSIQKIMGLRIEFETMMNLSKIRYYIDTRDAFYKKENDFFNEQEPVYQNLKIRFYHSLIHSKFRNELEHTWGKQIFILAELQSNILNKNIINELKSENRLNTEYFDLCSAAKMTFRNNSVNLKQLESYFEDPDRKIRKDACGLYYQYFDENKPHFDTIFDKLVKIRHSLSKKMGFRNFIEVGYARFGKSDYTPEMIASFRDDILEFVVPFAMELRAKQKKRLQLDSLHYYDEKINFPSGNAKPEGDFKTIITNAGKMFKAMSPETDEFFNFMVRNELFDLEAKKGKVGLGYCGVLGKYDAPFIFSNFNGTSGDINVLVHEAGHAFQIYMTLRNNRKIPEYFFPTPDGDEIPSMTMELLTFPFATLFFGEASKKFIYSHLCGLITSLPYMALGDEFQHHIYENPNLSPAERHDFWRETEQKYFPDRDYNDNEYLDKGGLWQRQPHFYFVPFYFIDYGLAAICALQFHKRMSINKKKTWDDFLTLCKTGGSKSFLELVKLSNLQSPFESGCVESSIHWVKEVLSRFDNTVF